MVDIKTTRTHRLEDGKVIAIRTEKFINGDGHPITRTTEETFSYDKVDQVLNDIIPTVLSKMDVQINDLEKKIIDIETDEEFKNFCTYMQKYMEFKKDEEQTKQLHKIQDQRKDVMGWKQQFEAIREDLNKNA